MSSGFCVPKIIQITWFLVMIIWQQAVLPLWDTAAVSNLDSGKHQDWTTPLCKGCQEYVPLLKCPLHREIWMHASNVPWDPNNIDHFSCFCTAQSVPNNGRLATHWVKKLSKFQKLLWSQPKPGFVWWHLSIQFCFWVYWVLWWKTCFKLGNLAKLQDHCWGHQVIYVWCKQHQSVGNSHCWRYQKRDFGHFQSLEQNIDATDWVARYDFLLVFYSEFRSRRDCSQDLDKNSQQILLSTRSRKQQYKLL